MADGAEGRPCGLILTVSEAAYGRRRIAAAPRAGRGAVMSGDLAWRPWDRTRRIQGPAGGEVGWFHLVWLD